MDIGISYSDAIRAVSLIVALVGAILVVRQLKLTREGHEKDHTRRKNEATLNAFNAVRDDIRQHDDEVCSYLGLEFDGQMGDENLTKIMLNPDKRASLRIALHYLSRFATGVKYDIYSFDVLYDLNGEFFLLMYKRYLPYIKNIQSKKPSFYIELCHFFERVESESRYR